MSLRGLFEWLDALESSVALRESLNAYPILLTVHVISMCLFAGLIAFLDLRLVGATLKTVPVSSFPKRIFPWALTGFGISVVTGLLLLYSQPMRYYGNFYFWLKTGLILLAGINMWVFHVTIYRSVDKWDTDAEIPRAACVAGVVSLVLWAAVVSTGRLIAYSGLVPDWWKGLNLT